MSDEVPPFPKLAKAQVPYLPPAAYYVADFISEEEERHLLRKIAETPQPKWKTVGSGRRLQYWGGTLSKSNTLVPEPMPSWLNSFPDIIERINSFLDLASDFKNALGTNQVLINEYQPGQGIYPHQDGPAFRPLVATLSLGSHTVLDLHHYVSSTSPSPPMTASEEGDGDGKAIAAVPLGHVLLLPRSLFILTGSLYCSHLHGIEELTRDTCVAPLPKSTPAEPASEEATTLAAPPTTSKTRRDSTLRPDVPVIVANAGLLDNPDIEAALQTPQGWSGKRGTRTSLTFRRANKTAKAGLLALATGGRR